jgi:hypothetical protein
MNIDIEKQLLPNNKKLIVGEYFSTAEILDAELDPLHCSFVWDSVEINTKDYSYITLSLDNLQTLIKLLKLNKKLDDKKNV